MTATQLRLGPADHGRPLTVEEFESADYAEGFQYELIDGSLEVSPAANFPEDSLAVWLHESVLLYSHSRPDVINYVTPGARVFIPDRPRLTCPQPDVAAYAGFPRTARRRDVNWRDVSPVLVCEVLVDSDPRKDLVRNVALYLQVPSIQEYWVLDGRIDPDEPALIAHRRSGDAWDAATVGFGATYETPLLPGFTLAIDPRR